MKNSLKNIPSYFVVLTLLLVGVVGYGQVSAPDLLTVTQVQSNTIDNLNKYNVVLNTSTAQSCSGNFVIEVNLGVLELVPGTFFAPSNSGITMPNSLRNVGGVNYADITIPVALGVSGDMGFSVKFPNGVCNNQLQTITSNLKCDLGSVPLFTDSEDILSYTEVGVDLSINDFVSGTICYSNNAINYSIWVDNRYDVQVNSNHYENSKLSFELSKCAKIVGLYKSGVSVDIPIKQELTNSNFYTIDAGYNGIVSRDLYTYQLYVTYPCDGSCDLSPMIKPKVKFIGDYCGQTQSVIKEKESDAQHVFSGLNCTGSCPAGDVILPNELESFQCPNCSTTTSYILNRSIVFAGHNYQNFKFIYDIPSGLTPSLVDESNPHFVNGVVVTYEIANQSYSSQQIVNQSLDLSTVTRISFDYSAVITTTTSTKMYNRVDFSNVQQIPSSYSYTISVDGNPTLFSKTKNISQLDCSESITLDTDVKKNNGFESSVSAIPGEIIRYRLSVRNSGKQSINGFQISNVINDNLEYVGNFKASYGILNTIASISPDINNEITIPNLGTATLVTPTISSNILSINSGNMEVPFYCNGDSDYLIFEFDVRVKLGLPAGLDVVNNMSINFTNSNNVSETVSSNLTLGLISVVSNHQIKNSIQIKCFDVESSEWSNSIEMRNMEEAEVKLELLNSGSLDIHSGELINLKPQPGDHLEINSLLRSTTSSDYTLNYVCGSADVRIKSIIDSNINITAPSGTTIKYSEDNKDTLWSTLIWSDNCSSASNWIRVKLPSDFMLLPGYYVELIYRIKGTGIPGQKAYNSFMTTAIQAQTGNQFDPLNKLEDVITITNTENGCSPVPEEITDCSLTAAGVDGSFNDCTSLAQSSFFSSNVECGSGWQNISNTAADLWQLPISGMVSHGISSARSDYITPLGVDTASKDGGVFAGALAAYGFIPSQNGFEATINHLVPGKKYQLDFEQINLTDLGYLNSEVHWKVIFGDESIPKNVKLSPSMTVTVGVDASWADISFEFIADQETQTLTFIAVTTSNLQGIYPIAASNALPDIDYPGFIYAGIDGIKMLPLETECVKVPCEECSSFDLDEGETYLVTGWAKQKDVSVPPVQPISYTDVQIEVILLDGSDLVIGDVNVFKPSGKIIDGWQRIIGEFKVPMGEEAASVKIDLVNTSTEGDKAYFDDIRIHPRDANMKSFVYDQQTQRLMSELDENNYSTYYEYDQEGGLVRIKKETEKGVYTIQETRSANEKKVE